jgi:hypothetical protein
MSVESADLLVRNASRTIPLQPDSKLTASAYSLIGELPQFARLKRVLAPMSLAK